jgi:glycosyltransferase involved in cell wall biosynthesis
MAKPILILVPAYRCESTVAETLVSIQQQGAALEHIREVVIAEDGSRDRTAEVARSVWQSPIPLNILARHYNCGEYASVNSAVDQFPPDIEWFLIMHADNVAKPGWLDTFLERIASASQEVGLIGSSYDNFDESGRTIPGENEPKDKIVIVPGTPKAVADTLKMGCWWHISSCAIRVSAYRKVGGLPKIMQLKGDWDFMLRILTGGWTIQHVPQSLMRYRMNPIGSSSLSFKRHMDIWETMTVMGRFAWALSAAEIVRLHAQAAWAICRRIVGCLIRLDLDRLLWALPALGCVGASCYSCLANRNPPAAKKTAPG